MFIYTSVCVQINDFLKKVDRNRLIAINFFTLGRQVERNCSFAVNFSHFFIFKKRNPPFFAYFIGRKGVLLWKDTEISLRGTGFWSRITIGRNFRVRIIGIWLMRFRGTGVSWSMTLAWVCCSFGLASVTIRSYSLRYPAELPVKKFLRCMVFNTASQSPHLQRNLPSFVVFDGSSLCTIAGCRNGLTSLFIICT